MPVTPPARPASLELLLKTVVSLVTPQWSSTLTYNVWALMATQLYLESSIAIGTLLLHDTSVVLSTKVIQHMLLQTFLGHQPHPSNFTSLLLLVKLVFISMICLPYIGCRSGHRSRLIKMLLDVCITV